MDKPMNKDGVTDAMIEAGEHAFEMEMQRDGMPDDGRMVSDIYLAMLRASPPVSTDGLVERLREVESSTASMSDSVTTNWYRNPDGPEAADRIEQLTATLADRDATIEGMREALAIIVEEWNAYTGDSDEWPDDPCGVMNDAYKRDFIAKARAALDASATDHD